MTQNVGEIEYSIGIDTKNLLVAEKTINKSVGGIETSLRTIQTQQTKTSQAVNKGLASMGRSAGQAGIQIQQFIGQVQGGQSAMLALSQQGADLGIVLGAPLLGAIIGISSSIAGMLLPSLFEGANAMADLDAIAEELAETLQDAGDGTEVLSDKILKLAKRSEALARLKISEGITQSEQQIKIASEAIQETLRETGIISGQFYDSLFNPDQGGGGTALSASIVRRTLEDLQEEFGITEESARGFAIAMSQASVDPSVINIKALENALSDLNDETGGSNEKIIKLASTLLPFFESVTSGVDRVNLLRIAFTDINNAIKETNESLGRGEDELREFLQIGQSFFDQEISDLEAQMKKRNEIEQKASDERKRIRENEAKAAENANRLIASTTLNFISSTTSALMSGMDEQSSAYQALFLLQKGAAAANAIISAESAAAAALAPPPVGLGPVAGAPLSGFVRAAGYASAGVIMGTAIAGGRLDGGQVQGQGVYRMGENNQPEILQTGAGLFGIPGDKGKVFNQSQLDQINTGSNVNVSVIVENNAPSASVSTSTSDDGRVVRIAVNEVARQIRDGQGPVATSLRQNTTTQLKGSR